MATVGNRFHNTTEKNDIYSIELIARFHYFQNISIVIISQWVCIKIINFKVSKFVSANCSEVIAAGTEWIVLFLYFAQKYGSFERQENIPVVAHHNHAAWHCDREHGKHNGRFVDILCTWCEKHLESVSEKCKYWIPTHDSLFVFWADEMFIFSFGGNPVETSMLSCVGESEPLWKDLIATVTQYQWKTSNKHVNWAYEGSMLRVL